MEKPKCLNGIFFVIIIVCANYPKAIIIVCTNCYCVTESVYKLCFKSTVNGVLKAKTSLPQVKEKFECVYSYMMLKLIQIMV